MKRQPLRPRDGSGFTLVELLVVIVIIALISAVALPVVLPALDERRVSEAARELQGALAGARDAAIRANAPRGIRLLPDPVLSPAPYGKGPVGVLTSNRYVPIEPGPDYSEGMVAAVTPPTINNPQNLTPYFLTIESVPYTPFFTSPTTSVQLPNEPTGWYFNVRQGDKIRFNNSGANYTVAGPMYTGPAFSSNDGNTYLLNPERYVNLSNPDSSKYSSPPFGWAPLFNSNNQPIEILYLVNGVDDDGDGWVDEQFDGIDNDGDGITDPGFNGVDDGGLAGVIDDILELLIGNEYEMEVFVGDPPSAINPSTYTIQRRAVVSPGTREVTLPDGIVIDMTTYNAASATTITSATQNNANLVIQFPERSRLPVDPYNFSVDILVSPSGQVVQAGAGASGIEQNNSAPTSNLPFYHFWLTERKGVVSPVWGTASLTPYKPTLNQNYPNQIYLLPMPQGTVNYNPPATQATQYLTGERRLVTMFTRSGQVVTNPIEIFNGNDINQPFYDAQAGIKESQ